MGEADKLRLKKEQVLSNKPKFSSTTAMIIIIISTMVIGGFFIARSQAKDVPAPPRQVTKTKITDSLDYGKRRYDMKKIKIEENGKNVIFSLADIKKYRMVRFDVKSGGLVVKERNFGKRALPLLAYITPSGFLTVAISYCEPCRSTAFHTETDLNLVCNVCGTRWDLENEVAISGACMPYPPASVSYKITGGKVYLEKKEISTWKPRVEI